MNTRTSKVIVIVVLFFGLLYVLLALLSARATAREQAQRINLANELGVRIEDYPREEDFPIGYIVTELKPGMAIEDVHEIIKGYEKVYHCKKYSEIYYFYSEDDLRALRIEILFDNDLNYKDYRTEDRNSRTIQLFGCTPGLIR